jgi:general secretion pathway protein B
VSFILDALRKSEHERQRSTVPGLSQVPLATPEPHLPRWALGVMAVLGAALLVVAGAWWQSTHAPGQLAATQVPTVERSVELPPAAAVSRSAPSRPLADEPAVSRAEPGLADAAAARSERSDTFTETGPVPRAINLPDDAGSLRQPSAASLDLPSAAALAAQGIAVPTLHLELHAYSEQPRDRFVFINGRKYVEGDRLPEGPVLVAIEPMGAVLTHGGRRFLVVQD